MTLNYENKNPFVFLDIRIGEEKAGRVVIELFKDIVPKSVENFRTLCTGEKGDGSLGKLSFKNSIFHRVVPQFIVQGGDITNADGSGGESIYGKKFEDENFIILHTEEGRVGMANCGPNTNNSQFYVTTVPCSHLDNRNVVFGQVRKGLNIFREMENVPRNNDNPIVPCLIENCGELKPNESWNINECDGTTDVYPPWPDDWDVQNGAPKHRQLEEAVVKIKESGNFFFKKQNYVESDRKYLKALRYIDYLFRNGGTLNIKVVNDMKISSLLNLAAVRLRKNKYSDARSLCDQVLTIEPNNGKALYRRAQARMGLKDYDKALTDLRTALTLCPNDKFIQLEIRNAKLKKLFYLQREKSIFTKMFQ